MAVTAAGQGARCDVMKAIVQDRFGPPDVLRLADIDLPEIGPGDVLVRVCAAGLNPYDWHMLRGDPLIARLIPGATGLTRPKYRVAGLDAAGVVEAVGADVRGLSAGDEVLGFCPGRSPSTPGLGGQGGAQAAGLTFEQAAAIPIAARRRCVGVQEVGRVRAGHRVLVDGAAGGVGSYAVQIAAALDAEVTGVCSARNAELVRSLGAAHVIDYTTDDFTRERARYDVILDNVGNQPLSRLRRVLVPAGILVLNGGGSPGHVVGPLGAMLWAAAVNGFRPAAPSVPPYPGGTG